MRGLTRGLRQKKYVRGRILKGTCSAVWGEKTRSIVCCAQLDEMRLSLHFKS